MSAKEDLPFRVRPPRPGEWPKTAADAALLATDPDGALVAADDDGRILGRAAAAVREDALGVDGRAPRLPFDEELRERTEGPGRL